MVHRPPPPPLRLRRLRLGRARRGAAGCWFGAGPDRRPRRTPVRGARGRFWPSALPCPSRTAPALPRRRLAPRPLVGPASWPRALTLPASLKCWGSWLARGMEVFSDGIFCASYPVGRIRWSTTNSSTSTHALRLWLHCRLHRQRFRRTSHRFRSSRSGGMADREQRTPHGFLHDARVRTSKRPDRGGAPPRRRAPKRSTARVSRSQRASPSASISERVSAMLPHRAPVPLSF